MFDLACRHIPFSLLLLTASLSGFCAGSFVELTEGEVAGSEIEEVILSRHKSDDLAASKPIYNSPACRCHNSLLGPLRAPVHGCSENSARNGIGAPLAL